MAKTSTKRAAAAEVVAAVEVSNGGRSIHSRAMLVALRISSWTAQKFDKRISGEVADKYAVESDAGRYNKHLMPKWATAYHTLMGLLGEVRTKGYLMTLAWDDEGWRVLPVANYFAFTAWFRDAKVRYEAALAEFLAGYVDLVGEITAKRSKMVEGGDYPPVSEVARRFGLSVDFKPIPSGGDFRVALADDEIRSIAASTEQRVKAAWEGAKIDAVQRLYKAAAHMHERLANPNGIFRDTLVEGTRELCEVMARLNPDGDPVIDGFREQLEALTIHDPATLREDTFTRESVAQQAADIMSSMAGIYGADVNSGGAKGGR